MIFRNNNQNSEFVMQFGSRKETRQFGTIKSTGEKNVNTGDFRSLY